MTDRIARDPNVKGGKPMVAGLRITVEDILRWLANGDSPEAIAAEFPLTVADIRAALAYAADFMALAHMADSLADEANKPKYQPPTEEAP